MIQIDVPEKLFLILPAGSVVVQSSQELLWVRRKLKVKMPAAVMKELLM